MDNEIVSQEILKKWLYYNHTVGQFYWRHAKGNTKPWQKAGAMDAYGYISIKFMNKFYKAHRLAWLYVHGEMPKGEIDHVNRIKNDNSIENLRVATRKENNENKLANKNNLSGLKGVSFDLKNKTWFARIMNNGKVHRLGTFSTPEDASKAYIEAAKTFHTHNAVDA